MDSDSENLLIHSDVPPWTLLVSATLTGVAGCVTVSRLALRIHRSRRWQSDDLSIIVAWLCSLAATIGTVIFTNLLIQREKQWSDLQQWELSSTMCFYVGIFATQLSVTLCWLQLYRPATGFIRFVPYVLLVDLVAGTIVELVSYITLCHGDQGLWASNIERSCIGTPYGGALLVYYPSAFRCHYHLLLALAPLPIVQKLRLGLPQRLGLVVIGVAMIASAGASLRRVFILLPNEANTSITEFGGRELPCLLLWSCAEISIAIICANLIAFRGLLVDGLTKLWRRNDRASAVPKKGFTDLGTTFDEECKGEPLPQYYPRQAHHPRPALPHPDRKSEITNFALPSRTLTRRQPRRPAAEPQGVSIPSTRSPPSQLNTGLVRNDVVHASDLHMPGRDVSAPAFAHTKHGLATIDDFVAGIEPGQSAYLQPFLASGTTTMTTTTSSGCTTTTSSEASSVSGRRSRSRKADTDRDLPRPPAATMPSFSRRRQVDLPPVFAKLQETVGIAQARTSMLQKHAVAINPPPPKTTATAPLRSVNRRQQPSPAASATQDTDSEWRFFNQEPNQNSALQQHSTDNVIAGATSGPHNQQQHERLFYDKF